MTCICNETGLNQVTHALCEVCNGTPDPELRKIPDALEKTAPIQEEKKIDEPKPTPEVATTTVSVAESDPTEASAISAGSVPVNESVN